VRRFTLITIIALLLAIALAAFLQSRLVDRGDRPVPSPGASLTP
jgi:hypothetical protein